MFLTVAEGEQRDFFLKGSVTVTGACGLYNDIMQIYSKTGHATKMRTNVMRLEVRKMIKSFSVLLMK